MKLVVIESSFAGDVGANLAYARQAVKDSLSRGESPYASHLFFTQEGILDDTKSDERMAGILAGLAWGDKADKVAVYADLGLSNGMRQGLAHHSMRGVRVVIRWLDQTTSLGVRADFRARVEAILGYPAKMDD